MKFDNFVKYAGSNGTIFEASNGDKWLFFNSIGMKVPDGRNVCGNLTAMPDWIEELITSDDYDATTLYQAFVPSADSKASELMRRYQSISYFGEQKLLIDISNKAYGFIEKKDDVYCNSIEHDDVFYDALLITDDYGDEKEFKMICIVKNDLCC